MTDGSDYLLERSQLEKSMGFEDSLHKSERNSTLAEDVDGE